MKLQAVDIHAAYGVQPVLKEICVSVESGQFVGIIGPNGCGKSTLLKVLGGILLPTQGHVLLDHERLHSLSRRRRAQYIGLVPQHPTAPPGMTVRQLVSCGRTPHVAWFRPFDASDHRAVEQAIERCDLAEIVDRPLAELSGGERQRAWIAMAICQQSQILLLDEPTAALDIGHQLEVMGLLQSLCRECGLTIIMAIHDLNLALRHCSRLLTISRGGLAADMPTAGCQDFSPLENVFGVRIEVLNCPDEPPVLKFRSRSDC